jgi:hypothetical protein
MNMENRLPKNIRVSLTPDMAQALLELSIREKRLTRDQAYCLILDGLIRLGLLGVGSRAEKKDTGEGASLAGNIGA